MKAALPAQWATGPHSNEANMTQQSKEICHACQLIVAPIDIHGQLVCPWCTQSIATDADGVDRNFDEQETPNMSEHNMELMPKEFDE